VLHASRGIWAEAVDVARDAGLRQICERAGLVWADCQAALHDPGLRMRVEADTEALAAIGHWGVPVFVFDGEPFWGQDRIEDLELALRDAGLAHESPAAGPREGLGAPG
jgi:2-hydroxychromene-2-carboxylate isomerase